ncbi:MAG: hypothetical protein IJ363_04690 [Clostridia bacterium]|nr:hypothetical protein [Clostridia bacterium]
MRTSELQTALQALDHLPMPDKTAALGRANAYAKAGITALDPPAYPLPTPRPPLLRRPALAAAVTLSVIGVGAGAVAGVDLYHYNTASDFFADYRLSTDGISRSDLWEVYRDVVTGQFSLPATGQMLQSNAGLSPSDSLSAEEAESLWEGWKDTHMPSDGVFGEGVTIDTPYSIQIIHNDLTAGTQQSLPAPRNSFFFTPNAQAEKRLNPTDVTYPIPDYMSYDYTKSDTELILQRKDGDSILWSLSLGKLDYVYLSRLTVTEDCVVAIGYERDGTERRYRVFMISPRGELIKSVPLGTDTEPESLLYTLCEKNTVTLFTCAGEDSGRIRRTVYELSGDATESTLSTLPHGRISNVRQVIPLGDGHLLVATLPDAIEQNVLYRMNAMGEITNCYTLEDGGLSAQSYTDPFDLHIDRIQESNGYLYISITGTSATRLSRVVSWCNGYLHSAEDSWLGSEIFSGNNYGIPQNELANRVRACYRAFLLVCDPATMEILSVTVMDGAYPTEHQGSAIPSIETDADGHILWVVESPYATIYSPFTSSFSMAGDSYRYTFTLTPEGKVVGAPVIQTGIGYRR